MGRVKVARAGASTSVLAVLFTLFDAAANGRAITKMALPTSVAAKQTGRTTSASAAVDMESACALGVAKPPISARHRREMIFIFIVEATVWREEGLVEPNSFR